MAEGHRLRHRPSHGHYQPTEVHAEVAEVHGRRDGRCALLLGQDECAQVLSVYFLDVGRHATRGGERVQRPDGTEVGADCPEALARGHQRELLRGGERSQAEAGRSRLRWARRRRACCMLVADAGALSRAGVRSTPVVPYP
jgi:hypothetical protein